MALLIKQKQIDLFYRIRYPGFGYDEGSLSVHTIPLQNPRNLKTLEFSNFSRICCRQAS